MLTRQRALPVLRWVIAVPATRTVRGIATEVPIGLEDGMPEACVLSLDNLTTVPRSLFVERICQLNPVRMHEVCLALAVATACGGEA